jgi:Bacterial Ig-like domain (group 2)
MSNRQAYMFLAICILVLAWLLMPARKNVRQEASIYVHEQAARQEKVSKDKTPPPAPVLAAMNIVPTGVSMAVGQNQQFCAQGLDNSGNPIVPGIVVWTSSNPQIGTVNTEP